MIALKLFGVGLAIYGAYGVWVGEVYTTYNGETRLLTKENDRLEFWGITLSYIFVGCLIFVLVENKFG